MAKKKKDVETMGDVLSDIQKLKNVDPATMVNVLEESFRNVLAKIYGTDEGFQVTINAGNNGGCEILRQRVVVGDGEVINEAREIALKEALVLDDAAEIGDEVFEQVNFSDFGRRAVINLRQAVASKVLELQKNNFRDKFKARVGQVIVATVDQVWKREAILVDEDGNELYMPKSEQIPGEFLKKDATVRAVIKEVEDNNGNPKVILSRSSGEFLQRLLEENVPEIADGLIMIRAIARMPGERAKVAVESYDDRIDPVGACVGIKGGRISGIVKELHGENIDVTTYTTNTALFIQRALSPAKIKAIALNEEEKQAEVYIESAQVPLAIGKNASNLRLASLLTGYRIEVFRDGDADADGEDIYLTEFADEIDEWVIKTIQMAGYTTAKAVLKKTRDELIEETDLEESTIDHVLAVLRSEFEGDDLDEEFVDENVAEDESDA